MSVTTTANPATYTLQSTLAEYGLHHSEEVPLDTSLNAHPSPSTPNAGNPATWPTDHRRVPAYRPVNRQLDQTTRRRYTSTPEQIFVGIMFTGVWVEGTYSWLWRKTLGKVHDVSYKIGGEW
ncbi:hypothetical protein BCR34DRAFT_210704 [Clohesyomyces aquaticus]|uniref:Uncharacterized protein n=1 Tax=Clohesyomyces aquaticus TaxID=1231657 RepID=A0A1Y2A9Y7_9PLEO|nr:hypothetical protein BCR34DRAFT_210704 [Clohesyomyces aquaticus]